MIDGRGARGARPAWRSAGRSSSAWRCASPRRTASTRPIVMDATVAQLDGYRFVYVLPLAPTRLLIEDTCYSDDPALDRAAAARPTIAAYARGQGWRVAEIVREEAGVLPIALAGDIDAYWADAARAASPTPACAPRSSTRPPATRCPTPSRLADADRRAAALASARAPAPRCEPVARPSWRARGFFRLLNRMLFRAAEPASATGCSSASTGCRSR